jgi:enolase
VPSGASTGTREAVELRDGDRDRYGGQGVTEAVAPVGAPDMPEAVRAGAEVYARLKARPAREGHPTGLGDEGGFAPDIARPADVLALLVEAITDSGYMPSHTGIAIAPAASEFRDTADGRYRVAGEALTSDQLIDRYEAMCDRFPIWSIEDGLGEDDWDGWVRLTERLGHRVQLVGDDLFVTNPAIIAEAIEKKAANASLLNGSRAGSRSGSRATWSRKAPTALPKLSISAATAAGATRPTRVRAALHSLRSSSQPRRSAWARLMTIVNLANLLVTAL